jgi:hypothetical protein
MQRKDPRLTPQAGDVRTSDGNCTEFSSALGGTNSVKHKSKLRRTELLVGSTKLNLLTPSLNQCD